MIEAEGPEPIAALTAVERILGAVVEDGAEVEGKVIVGARAGAKSGDALAVGGGLRPDRQDGGDAVEVAGVAIRAADEDFVATAAGDNILAEAADEEAEAAAAEDGVVAIAAVEHGAANAATERVVTVAAIHDGVNGSEVGENRNRIVAAVAIDDDAADGGGAAAASIFALADAVDHDADEGRRRALADIDHLAGIRASDEQGHLAGVGRILRDDDVAEGDVEAIAAPLPGAATVAAERQGRAAIVFRSALCVAAGVRVELRVARRAFLSVPQGIGLRHQAQLAVRFNQPLIGAALATQTEQELDQIRRN